MAAVDEKCHFSPAGGYTGLCTGLKKTTKQNSLYCTDVTLSNKHKEAVKLKPRGRIDGLQSKYESYLICL